MSVIEAASVKVATMSDGTLRITCDIEPSNAQAAFALFGSPGTPMALAALKVGHAIPKEPEAAPTHEPQTLKGGNKAKDAAIICGDTVFQTYAFARGYSPTADGAANLVRDFCCVESRAHLDHDPNAAALFGKLMEKYRDWQKQPA